MTGKLIAACASLLILMLPPHAAWSEDIDTNESVFFDYLNPPRSGGFLHIPGLQLQSSMGVTYYSSGQLGSVGVGYYMGHFCLRLSSSWSMHGDVGIMTNFTGPDAGQHAEIILPSFDLIYRPSDNFILRFQYRQYRSPTMLFPRRYW